MMVASMSDNQPSNQPSFPLAFLQRLRFPQLFVLLLLLLFADLLVPDPIPFLDEALLGLLTLIMGSLRRRDLQQPQDEPVKPAEKNVTPR
jgi:hypothetical protein